MAELTETTQLRWLRPSSSPPIHIFVCK